MKYPLSAISFLSTLASISAGGQAVVHRVVCVDSAIYHSYLQLLGQWPWITSWCKRRKEAEFLVLGDIPPESILGYVVFNQEAQDRLLALGKKEEKVLVRPSYYF